MGLSSKSCTNQTEILRSNGYSTLLTGKWHLTQTCDRTATASFNSWPLYQFTKTLIQIDFSSGHGNTHWCQLKQKLL
ncbi:hypothetical protein [Nostoc sp.]|uniref:hypothetical protein n=1 Tax=Nostoc sp. TaxID=1180 RepID=UPI002FF4A7AF